LIVRIARFSFLALLMANGPGFADVLSQRPDMVAVTFYHEGMVDTADLLRADPLSGIRESGIAFITETRTIDLPAGPATVKLEDVASTMVPETATIEGLPQGVLEQNFDYDLLSPGSLLANSVGETVRLVRTDTKTGKRVEQTAIIRSGPNGTVFEVDGKFEALHCSALPEKLVFDHLPGGLADTPTLSVRTDAPAAGHYTIKLSYIATGLNWSADYVARVEPGSNTLALSGWLTLANFSATSFEHVPVDVVAGELQTTGNDTPQDAKQVFLPTDCWPTRIEWGKFPPAVYAPSVVNALVPPPPPAPGQDRSTETVVVTASKRIEAQALGDYKLYPLPEPVTVAANQTKQVQFLDQSGVAFERLYQYSVYSDEPDSELQKADIVLRLRNDKDGGLGKPLPAGGVSVFEKTRDGIPILTGQDSIRDMAVGLPFDIKIGRAMDIPVAARLVNSTTSGRGRDRRQDNEIEIVVQNRKAISVAFEFRQVMAEMEIASESEPHALRSGYAAWDFRLAPGERKILRYAIRHPL